jgi:hypothetical protein
LNPLVEQANFLVATLDRKLAYVKYGTLYRSAATFEAAVLMALSSIYGIGIDEENVEQSRQLLRADIAHCMNLHLNTVPVSVGFWRAVDAILATNVLRADTLTDAQNIRLIEYCWQRRQGMTSGNGRARFDRGARLRRPSGGRLREAVQTQVQAKLMSAEGANVLRTDQTFRGGDL